MNTAIILAGGIGTRVGNSMPKQFIPVASKPIIGYCLDTFNNHKNIDKIVIVANDCWHDIIKEYVDSNNISKFICFAQPGKTRQHSLFNGLIAAQQCTGENDIVIIHDAARPLVSNTLISDCIQGAKEKDGAIPVIPVADTIYVSKQGKSIDGLLNRDELFAGQAPESFNFGKYLKIHQEVKDEEISLCAGSSVIAVNHAMQIKLVKGDRMNFKITTKEDLASFEAIVAERQ